MISLFDGYKKIKTFPSQKRLRNIWTVEIRGARADLIPAIKTAQESGRVPQELGEFFSWLVDQWAKKKHYYRYTFYEDMKASAMLAMCQATENFNIKNAPANPFQYFLIAGDHAIRRMLMSEDKQARIKDRQQYLQDIEVGFVSL